VFIAMEYVEGQTPRSCFIKALAMEKVLRYSSQISAALAHAHEKGVIHGDLKPSNIIVTPQGDAKILDFGLARRGNPVEFDRKTMETASAEAATRTAAEHSLHGSEQIEGREASPERTFGPSA